MSLLEIIAAVRDLTTAIKAGDWPTVLTALAKLLTVAADLVAKPKAMQVAEGECGDLELACTDLRSCCEVQTVGAGADPKAIDPATIIVIVQLVGMVIEWIKQRRQG